MGDIELIWDPNASEADFAIEADDLASDESFRTAVLLSLFTDRRANDTDVLPDENGPRQGWWGDAYAEKRGDKIGSRRWLLGRAKLSPAILPSVEIYDRESLAWLVEDCAVASFDLEYEIVGEQLSTRITFYREDETTFALCFDHVWDAEENPGGVDGVAPVESEGSFYTLLQTVEAPLGGGAISSLDFTGLDGNTDVVYVIEFYIDMANTNDLRLRFNDTGSPDGDSRRHTPTSSFTRFSADLIIADTTGANDYTEGRITVLAPVELANWPRWRHYYSDVHWSSSLGGNPWPRMHAGYWENNTSNITKISIVDSVGGTGIGEGSWMRLYRLPLPGE